LCQGILSPLSGSASHEPLAALGGQAVPDGYGKLLLPGRRPASFLLELDRATEDHERLRQKARRYASTARSSICPAG
jgi:hypothetical protein